MPDAQAVEAERRATISSARVAADMARVLDAIKANPGINVRDLCSRASLTTPRLHRALEAAGDQVRTEPAPRGSTLHFLRDQ